MYQRSAQVYDLVYGQKDYRAEAAKVRDVIKHHSASGGRALLDVGCGTGVHVQHLAQHFDVTGIDLEASMIEIARERVPQAEFFVGDMRAFDLGRQFDAVTNLFSAIGHTLTVEGLNAAVATMARHARPGGVVVIEPWFYPGQLSDKYVSTRHVDAGPQFQVVRMTRTTFEGDISILHFHYMVGTLEGIEYFSEEHRLAMFRHEQYVAAFQQAGLAVSHETPGLTGRGLFIGVKPS